MPHTLHIPLQQKSIENRMETKCNDSVVHLVYYFVSHFCFCLLSTYKVMYTKTMNRFYYHKTLLCLGLIANKTQTELSSSLPLWTFVDIIKCIYGIDNRKIDSISISISLCVFLFVCSTGQISLHFCSNVSHLKFNWMQVCDTYFVP